MLARLLLLFILIVHLNGCVLTKVATVPMRVGGAVISVVPAVGNPIDEGIDTVADGIDKVPI
jgi:hypothetical protein